VIEVFKKRLLILVIPVVLAGWAAQAQESGRTHEVARSEIKRLTAASPEEFRRIMRSLMTGPDLTVEVVGPDSKLVRIEKKGDKLTFVSEGEPAETHTVAELDKMFSDGMVRACKSNLKNIATAAEMYSIDFDGSYPATLGKLTPNYLKFIPQCPSTEKDNYSTSWTCASSPGAFTMYCRGANHTKSGLSANFPQYTSFAGIAPAETKPTVPISK
jgi:hypothetical protein